MAKTERIQERSAILDEQRGPRTWLVRVGNARDPLAPPEVYSLERRERLTLGRSDGPPSGNPDRVEVPDPWMSSDHAVLEQGAGGWVLRDMGSSNGTLTWGQPRSSHTLSDGDVFETGSTFWLFRSRVIADEDFPGPRPDPVVGTLHPDLLGASRKLVRLAKTNVPIMLFGATGTGKEVLARAVHEHSGRPGPFIAINTAAVQSNLVASELFGVEKGAHSMADRSRQGQIRAAQGGTVLLDEIGDMPLEVQVSLLRVLQEHEVMPVGGEVPVKVETRFICATHQDIPGMVNHGTFRADLFARLKGGTLTIPNLCDRPEDIGRLIGIFLKRFDGPDLALSPAAYRALVVYEWPLNVRELEKTLEASIAICDGKRIELEHFPEEIRDYAPPAANAGRGETTEKDRERELMRLLTAHRGNVSAVARSMGYSRMQVHRWLKQLQVDPSDYRG